MSGEMAVECFTGGGGHQFLREGWSDIAQDTWTVGRLARIELPPGEPESDYSLRLQVADVAGPSGNAVQRIGVIVNQTRLADVICRGNEDYEFFVPRTVLPAGQNIQIAFELPNALRPIDFGHNADRRFLALRVVRVSLTPFSEPRILPPQSDGGTLQRQREALLEIESLGVNCEVGFVQRMVGAEPLGLFRWTFAPLQKLVPALANGLAGLGQAGSLRIEVDGRTEFIVRDTIYGFQYHSFLFEDQGATLADVERNEYNRLSYLSRSLMEELRAGGKLFCYHDAGASGLEDVQRLVRAIRAHGENTLLWLVPAPESSLVGTAQLTQVGLIRGYVSGFQQPVGDVRPESAHQPSWLNAMLQAQALWRAQQ